MSNAVLEFLELFSGLEFFSLGGSEALFIHDILRLVALFRNFLSFQCQGKENLFAYFLF